MVMVTIGLLILLRGLILVLFGPQVRPFPIIFPLQPVIIGDILIPRSLFVGGMITIVVGLGLSWFFNRTRRSEEHTSELQSLMRISYAVFCLKKKKNTYRKQINKTNSAQ